ncbi:MAG: ABC transporter ATP-binding protein [Verrucomicrobiota bacterium]
MSEKQESLLELKDICKAYQAGGGRRKVDILRGLSLRVAHGDSLAVVGPSGVGKSTLLNVMGGLDRADSGQALLGGRDLAELSDDELSRLRLRQVGFIFQEHHLLPQCSALENVLMPTLPLHSGRSTDEDMEKARGLLSQVGLAGRMNHRPGELSVGECQRVSVVRALINSPGLLLADEPTGSLDGASAASLADLLVDLNSQKGLTLVVVTHSMDLGRRMDRLMKLEDGNLHDID